SYVIDGRSARRCNMKYVRDIRRLRRYAVVSQFVSLLVFLFGVASLLLFFDFLLPGLPNEQAKFYRGNWIWLLTGVLFIIFGGIFTITAGRWSRHLIWIYRNVTPQTMILNVEIDSDADRTNYYAVLSDESEESQREQLWKVAIYSPAWDVRRLAQDGMTAKVYFEPKTLRPAVIETEYGLLWSMAGSGATELLARRGSGI